MALIDKINDGFRQLTTLVKGKVDKTAIIDLAHGGTGATTLTAAQTALGVDKVVSANTRLTIAKQTFPNVFVDSNGQLQKTQLTTWLDHAKMYNGLFPNGSFQMGDASFWKVETNPSYYSYDATDFPFGAQGCLKVNGGASLNLALDKIAVNPYMRYRMSAMVKYEKANSAPSTYCGLRAYDVDNNEISTGMSMQNGNTLTTLAQDLKVGDTVVYLTSLTNWTATTGSHTRGFKFYTYVDSRGFYYDPLKIPYSRYITSSDSTGWWDADAAKFNTSTNTITLNKPWNYQNPKDPNGIWRAGTQVAQVFNAGSFNYNLYSGHGAGRTGTLDWELKTVEISGFSPATTDAQTSFRAGTAYIAPFFLFNIGGTSTGDITKVSHLYFEKI